jgi:outer membrane protein assembly factor BamB
MAFEAAGKKLEVIALNRKNGGIVWRRAIPAKEIETVHATSSPATSTPVTDGKRVYVYSGSFGMVAYEWDGKPAWEYGMGTAKSPFGSGASPVLAGDLVVITRDYPPQPALYAIRKGDGTLAWKADLPLPTVSGPRTAHSTPLNWKDQIVLSRPGEISGYSAADGKRLWGFAQTSLGTSTAAVSDGVFYVNAPAMGGDTYTLVGLPPYAEALTKYDANGNGKLEEDEVPAQDLFFMKRGGVPDDVPGAHFTLKLFFRAADRNKDGAVDEKEYEQMGQFGRGQGRAATASGILAIRPSGEGALTDSALAWSEPRGAPEVTTPLEYRGRVYAMNSGGIVTCLEAKTGKVLYRGRVNAPGPYFASPVAAGGKVFVASAEGVVSVLGAGDTLEVLANNDLGEPVYGTPAVVGSTLYVRSARGLWAFGR